MKWTIKILVLGLLSGFLIFPFILILSLHLRVVSHQNKIHSISQTELSSEIIIMSQTEFEAARLDKHEFIYCGKRYDILRLDSSQGTIRLIAHRDWYEDAMLSEIISLHSGKNNPDQQINRILSPDWIFISWLPLRGKVDLLQQNFVNLSDINWKNTVWLAWFPPPDVWV